MKAHYRSFLGLLTLLAAIVLTGCKQGESPSGTQSGSISVSSTPSGAAILLDGNNTNKVTPSTLSDISTGMHSIKLRLTGYAEWEGLVTVSGGATAPVSAVMITATGKIFVSSTPPGANIYLNNLYTGRATPDTLSNIAVGSHTISVLLNDYEYASQAVTVLENQTVSMDFALSLIKVNVSIESFPSGAEIFVDGISTGQMTPSPGVPIPVGRHEIKLLKNGYQAYQDSFSFSQFNIPFIKVLLPILSKDVPGYPLGVTVDVGGNIYVAVDYTITKYALDGTLIWSFGSEGNGSYQFKRISDIQWNEAKLYVLDGYRTSGGNNRVITYDQNGSFITSFGLPSTDVTAPAPNNKLAWEGMAVDNVGYIHVVGSRVSPSVNPIRYGVYDSTGRPIVSSGDISASNGGGFFAMAAAVDNDNFYTLSNYGLHSWPRLSPPLNGSFGGFPDGFPQQQDMTLNAGTMYYACQTVIVKGQTSPPVYWEVACNKLAFANGKIYVLENGKLKVFDAF